MGLESIRTSDNYEIYNGCPLTDHYGTHLYMNRRRKTNPLVNGNGVNSHQYINGYCNSQIAGSNISNEYFLNTNNYNNLWRICKERGVLFEDPQFPPSNRALFGKKESSHLTKLYSSVVWMRPFQLVSRPKYISEYNPNRRFDVELGDGSNLFASNQALFHATSIIYSTPKIFDRVINPLQSFSPSSYAGIWRFRFWRFGDWIDVVIDDRLPTFKGRLMFMQCSDPSEFWAALLEKAYAKLYGSYEHYQRHCFTAQTTQDLTGGIAQSFTIGNHESHIIHQMITSAVPRSTLLSVCVNDVNPSETNAQNKSQRLRNGLLTRQSYLITGLTRVRTTLFDDIQTISNNNLIYNSTHFPIFGYNGTESVHNGIVEVQLIRLRNVSGKGEWNGAWSERSFEWDHLTDRDREELTIRCRTEGEFWIAFDDLLNNFTNLDLIHIGPDDWMQEMSLHHKRPWRAVLARRKWKKGFNAGGGPSHKDTFFTNPQFHIHIPKSGPNKIHVVVSVTQLYSTSNESQEINLKNIGFCVYEVPPNTIRLTQQFVANNAPLDITDFTATRESVTFFTLPPGDFVIVPTTDKPHLETKFLLRLFTDETTHIWEVNDDNIIFTVDSQIPKIVERIIKNGNSVLSRLMSKLPRELDAFSLLKVLKVYSKPFNILYEKPSLELCRFLVMLKDPTITGKITATSVSPLLNLLHFWRSLFTRHQMGNKNKICTYSLRQIFLETGISISNKVLESLVIRYSENSQHMTLESFLLSLVKLHLSHERYKSLERKGKQNNITLEEMILLTIYS